MGEVGLPGLGRRQAGCRSSSVASWAWGEGTGAGQDLVDGRAVWGRRVAMSEVPADRVCTGNQARVVALLAWLWDELDGLGADGPATSIIDGKDAAVVAESGLTGASALGSLSREIVVVLAFSIATASHGPSR